MLLFCPKCGKKMTEDMLSCAYCGAARVDENSVPPLFVEKGGRAAVSARKEPAAAVRPAEADDAAPKGKKSLASMFSKGDKAGKPAAEKPAGKSKHDLSSLFKRKPKDEPQPDAAVEQRRSALLATARGEEAPDQGANPFQPMAVAAEGSKDFSLVGELVYAGFWRRFFAALIDSFIMSAAMSVLVFVIGMLGLVSTSMGPSGFPERSFGATFLILNLIGILLPWLYSALFEASAAQATPGKRLLGLQVCDTDGQRISFLRATGRFWGKLPSFLLFMIGYLMQPFTKRKQALHDMMASCLVVKVAQ